MNKFISCLILFVVLISGIGFVCAEDSGINGTEVNTSQDNENIYYPADKLPSFVPVGSPLINTGALEPVYDINGEITGYKSLKYLDGIYRKVNGTDYMFQLEHTIGDKTSASGIFYDPSKVPPSSIVIAGPADKPADNHTNQNSDLNNISDDNSTTVNEEENSAVERNVSSDVQNDVNSADSQNISDVSKDVKIATGNPILVLLLALFVIGCNFFRQKKN